MCELFGISSSIPIQLGSSLALFRKRGGATADNPDGWGLAWMENGVFRVEKEPIAAVKSKLFPRLAAAIHSSIVLGHVRKAKHPTVNNFVNTHPFLRSCCGKEWVFAHNGLVPGIMLADETRLIGDCMPSGQTDSEHAFCFLLDQIAREFNIGKQFLESEWIEGLPNVSEFITTHGQFNFLLSDGKYLVAYGHDRLHGLERNNNGVKSVLIATEPLTENEPWQVFREGELRVYRAGELVQCTDTQPEPLKKESNRAMQ